MDDIRPPGNKSEMATVRGQRAMGSWAIEVTEFNSETRCDLRGHLEAAMASEALVVTYSLGIQLCALN